VDIHSDARAIGARWSGGGQVARSGPLGGWRPRPVLEAGVVVVATHSCQLPRDQCGRAGRVWLVGAESAAGLHLPGAAPAVVAHRDALEGGETALCGWARSSSTACACGT